ncbi:polyribonucleotide nucleotidyltransferase [candidate division WWE3 bacterium CG_4_10_14_0_2_um_filter_41_14]|uniref:Polyribonucleotide nucleotidyltransferase n=1 Tax=candidate division WWE3 bacterium CG_4_10_14_0_2_um_filter_41_14 TaxID=1975072 RepID=A0A2M7TLQ6_UNCKA|nr:MAG: polyribonucleotide nucleotidyltransferase [candidate division WWE3 bacterium CG_4_10_14_0_2_um_filter_41_14]
MAEIITQTIEVGGKTITLETGLLAQKAHGAVLARMGDTAVLATIVASDPVEGLDYFPLKVDYEERLYAGGIIKGSRWVKREGRPSEDSVLTARVIDRSIRPLFPKTYRDDVQVIAMLMSVDNENDPVVLALTAVSAALSMSGIPWNGPVSGVRIGRSNGEFVVNPTIEQLEKSDMDLFVTSTTENILMVEMGGDQVAEQIVLDGMEKAQEMDKIIVSGIKEFTQKVVDKKGYAYEYEEKELTEAQVAEKQVLETVKTFIEENFPQEIIEKAGEGRNPAQEHFLEKVFAQFEGKTSKGKMNDLISEVIKKKVRSKVLTENTRVDGRLMTQVRPLSAQVGLFARTHGTGLFMRGETHVLTVATLGSTSLEQLLETMHGEVSKRYMHHYNFPPYSVGETGRIGSPGRREIGHGALAERALMAVIPSREEFPYTIRLVSEVMSSNGSTSMASVCGSTLALMDAGVPIKEPVSGIAMGLMKDGDNVKVLTDIQGIEDFYGDMDFKVAGTKSGITALQMDVKIDGITREILEIALTQAKAARLEILDVMLAVIDVPRDHLSTFAPRIKSIKIDPAKIGEIIGPGGKNIRALQEDTSTEIDIDEDGTVHISGVDPQGVQDAYDRVDQMTREIKVGEVYHGKVVRLMDFGAFVEILPGRDGLVHVSELSPGFVKSVSDEVSEGDEIDVKVIKIDDQGRINLSRKALMGDQKHQEQNPA